MDMLLYETARTEHRHGDAWHEMHVVRRRPSPSDTDREREWAEGVILRCPICEDEIRIRRATEPGNR